MENHRIETIFYKPVLDASDKGRDGEIFITEGHRFHQFLKLTQSQTVTSGFTKYSFLVRFLCCSKFIIKKVVQLCTVSILLAMQHTHHVSVSPQQICRQIA